MKPKYIIVRAHPDLGSLLGKVNAETEYSAHGQPFRDNETLEWCQMMTLNASVEIGEVRLREPQKARR